MSQALNPTDDVEALINPGAANNNNNNNNQNAPNAPQQPQQPQPAESTFTKMTSSMKESTMKGAKDISEKSKERLSMEGQLKQARVSLEKYVNPKILNKQINEDTTIPKWVLKRAKGLVFLTVLKAGFLVAGNVGTGVIIVRKPNGGWTGPSSIGVAGLSFGFLAGASKVDYIMILPDDKAVNQFAGKGQIRLGGELQLAVGPIGRDGSGSVGAGDTGVSVIYSYSHAQGLYGGLALDGKVISVRPDCNKAFYKRSVECSDIIKGNIDKDAIPNNEDYDMIVHLLDSYCLDDDMTPIKGEKLSIDDLNKPKADTTLDGHDEEEKKQANDEQPGSVMNKLSMGFNKFTSSVSQKFLALTASEENENEKKKATGNEQVKLQQAQEKAKANANVNVKPGLNGNAPDLPPQAQKQQQQRQQGHGIEIKQHGQNGHKVAAAGGNNGNYQIGDDDDVDMEED